MRNAFVILAALALAGCRTATYPYLDEPVDGGDTDGILVTGDGFVTPPDGTTTLDDGSVPPPLDDGSVPPVDFVFPPDPDLVPPPPPPIDDGFIPPPLQDGFVFVDDGFVFRPDLPPPPIDLAVTDLAGRDLAVDGSMPGDFGGTDFSIPDGAVSDLVVTVDMASACRAGHYAGPLTGAIFGTPMNGTFDFTLGAGVGGVFPVTAGTMVATGAFNSTYTATLSGSLDCGTRLLTGNINNGVLVVQGQRLAYTGTWNGAYNALANRFINGTYLINVPQSPFGPLVGNGTWQSN